MLSARWQVAGSHALFKVCSCQWPPLNDPVLIMCYLEIGAHTFLLDYIHNAKEAEGAVRVTKYPSTGIWGISAWTLAT
jgi:2-keto-3-deoxy-L-rhamnonate aldolase RhmA